MRFALIGNSGTGKTLLAESLASRLGLPLVPEFARDLIREWNITEYHSLGQRELDTLVRLQLTILDRKLEMEARLEDFVADRATVDTAVIWLKRLASRVDPDLTRSFVERCRQGMARYDRLFLLPSDIIPLEEDGIRQTQWGSRLLFDAALLGLLKIWGYSHEVVESESLEERIAEVRRRLDLF